MPLQQSELEARRRRAGRLFLRGMSQAEVARRCEVSRTTAMRWHRDFEASGIAGLTSKGPRGRPSRLSAADLRKVERILLQGPLKHGYRTDLWSLPRVAEVIKKTTGESYHPGHVWRILRRLGWSPQRPTTRAKEKDEKAVQRWIRSQWPRIKKGLVTEPR